MCTSLFLRSGPFSCLLTQTPNPTSLFPSISCLHTRLTGQGGMGRRWELPLERGSSQHSVKYRPLAVRASNNPSPSYCFFLRLRDPGTKGESMGFMWVFLGNHTIACTHRTITHFSGMQEILKEFIFQYKKSMKKTKMTCNAAAQIIPVAF